MSLQIRQSARYRFSERDICVSKIIDKGQQNEFLISTQDLSPTGIAFYMGPNKDIEKGSTITLEVAPFGAHPIRCSAEIVRAEATNSGILYGAKFLALPLLYQERLYQMIRTALFNQQLDRYAQTRDLRIRLGERALLNKLVWLALLVTTTLCAIKVLNLARNKDAPLLAKLNSEIVTYFKY